MEPKVIIVLACFSATLTAYVERVGFSIAFTTMAKQANLDEHVKGNVLSAFYWGYGYPGGWAAQLYGGRRTLAISFLAWSLACLLTPGDASSVTLTVLARVCVGLAQGGLIPSVHTVLSKWIPPHERARAVSLTTSGMYLGSAAAMLVLPSVSALFGASSLLRLVGLLGWRGWPDSTMPLTLLEAQLKPDQSRRASSAGGAALWVSLLRSSAVWAIVVNNFAFHYAFYLVMNWLPTYFNSVLLVDLNSLGVLKPLPYLVMFATSNVGGWLGDALILQNKQSVAAARKIVNTIGMLSATFALMSMPLATGMVSGVLATTLTMGTLGLSRGGFSVNHMDIAPKYAGVVMGISNTAGTLAGVIGVAVTGYILDAAGGASSIGGWWQAHSLAAGILVLAMFVFNAFAKGTKLFD
ncbi:major facilitator superfamily domain-containing protein [Scenedesmus sp. NREL 46B-D3]|nr:major facilitator superfamily domain-containing protein [Scenedesmus sp. NREL 46B-D3]